VISGENSVLLSGFTDRADNPAFASGEPPTGLSRTLPIIRKTRYRDTCLLRMAASNNALRARLTEVEVTSHTF